MSNAATRMVIWNPRASGAGRAESSRAELERDPRYDVHPTDSPDQAARLARQAKDNPQIEMVVAAGGDGTISTVINALCTEGGPNESTPLAMLPIGTANDLSRTLDVPLDAWQALELLDRPRQRRIDLARVRAPGIDRLFANVASGGNSSRVSEAMTEEMKKRWGAWCYLRGAIEVLQDLDGYTMRFACDDGPTETLSMWNFVVANGNSTGGIVVAPRADVADGFLDLIVIQDGTLLDLGQITAGVILQDYLKHENVVYRRVKRVSIETDSSTPAIADGEPIDGQPLTLTVEPGVLHVVVGPDFGS